MEGTRIVLIRHGESRAQTDGIVGGHSGCQGLSDRGRQQVEALRARLERTGELADATAIYTSIMPRAIETAEVVAAAINLGDVAQKCDFCEHHPGEGDGLTWSDFNSRYPVADDRWDPDLRRSPGAETWNEMHARVSRALDCLVQDHPGELVVVACHGGVIVQSMAKWFGIDLANQNRAWLNPANTSITEWRLGANPFNAAMLPVELVRFNDFGHLLS